MVDEQRFVVVRTLAIGPALFPFAAVRDRCALQFFTPIESHDFADLDRPRFERPIFDQPV